MRLKRNIAISESGFLFDPVNGESYSLNEQGKEILNLMKAGKQEKEIVDFMTEVYDVDRDDFERYFIDFTGMLKQFNLTEDANES
jgi:hypothetical protein